MDKKKTEPPPSAVVINTNVNIPKKYEKPLTSLYSDSTKMTRMVEQLKTPWHTTEVSAFAQLIDAATLPQKMRHMTQTHRHTFQTQSINTPSQSLIPTQSVNVKPSVPLAQGVQTVVQNKTKQRDASQELVDPQTDLFLSFFDEKLQHKRAYPRMKMQREESNLPATPTPVHPTSQSVTIKSSLNVTPWDQKQTESQPTQKVTTFERKLQPKNLAINFLLLTFRVLSILPNLYKLKRSKSKQGER